MVEVAVGTVGQAGEVVSEKESFVWSYFCAGSAIRRIPRTKCAFGITEDASVVRDLVEVAVGTVRQARVIR